MEALLTLTYYIAVIGLFIYSLILFVRNLRKPKEDRCLFPFVFFLVMTYFAAMTVAFVVFVLRLAWAMKSSGL